MTLGDDLPRLKAGNLQDPVTEAAKKGRVPTLRDVKKSVKVPACVISDLTYPDWYCLDLTQNLDTRCDPNGGLTEYVRNARAAQFWTSY